MTFEIEIYLAAGFAVAFCLRLISVVWANAEYQFERSQGERDMGALQKYFGQILRQVFYIWLIVRAADWALGVVG